MCNMCVCMFLTHAHVYLYVLTHEFQTKQTQQLCKFLCHKLICKKKGEGVIVVIFKYT